jgi:hypothetical protein
MSERLIRMRAPASAGGEYAMVPEKDVDHWRKQGAVVAPEQNLGELASRSTRSLNPVEFVRGVYDAASDPVGTVSGMASLPIDLATQAMGDLRQGNYLRAARKGFTAALPIAGGVGGAVLGIPGGPAGMIAGGMAGYAGGSGVAAGLDEGIDQHEQGNWATGTGALVDATVQGLLGARATTPRPNRAPVMADALERRARSTTARTFGPTVGPNRYGWGNEARKLGPEMLRRTTSNSREGVSLELEALRQRANANLDGGYDVAPKGVRLRAAPVDAALRAEINNLSVQTANGPVVPTGNAEKIAALQAARAELQRMGPTLDAKNVRTLRQSWDRLADQVWEPKTNAGWENVREAGKGFAVARDRLNDVTMQVYPHLKPAAAEASFSIKATDLLRQLEETENARSQKARSAIASVSGAAVGSAFGGAFGAGVGALVAPAVEYMLVEKVLPSTKIRAARLMTQLSDELRKNGQTARAVSLGQQIRNLAAPAASGARSNIALDARGLAQPLAADAQPETPDGPDLSQTAPLGTPGRGDRPGSGGGGGAIARVWEWANTPLAELPTIPLRANEVEELGREMSQNPGLRSSVKAALALGKRIVNIGAGVASGMTSPAGLTSMALSGGGAALGRAGYLGAARGAGMLEAGLSAPYVGTGLYHAANADTLEGKLAGGLEATLGAAGVRAGLDVNGFRPVRYGKDEQFLSTLARNEGGASLTDTAPQQLFRHRSGEPIYYGLNRGDNGEVDAVAFMNNSARRGMTPAVLKDASQRGATTLDAWAVKSDRFPKGLLPELYGREGWRVVETKPYDLSYGPPSEELKAAWRKQGWRDGDPLPDVVYMRPPALRDPAGLSGDTSAGATATARSAGGAGQSSPAAAPRAASDHLSTVGALAAPVAAQAIPEDPNSDWDNYLRAGLMGAGAMGMSASLRGKKPVLPYLERAPVEVNEAGLMRVSNRVPSGVKAPSATEPLSTGLQSVLDSPAPNSKKPPLAKVFAEQLREYPQITTREAATLSDRDVLERFVDVGADNRRYLIDKMDAAGLAPTAKLWYDGAHTISQAGAKTYGYSPNQSSGVLAVLSPNKDWYQNAEMADRMMRNVRQFEKGDIALSPDVGRYFQQRTMEGKERALQTAVRKGKLTAAQARKLQREAVNGLAESARRLVGKPWSRMNIDERAIFMRMYDELNNGLDYHILHPDGSKVGLARNQDGEPSKMVWQSYVFIKKALSILEDGSKENISRQLGNEHKVRAFFNNINVPNYGRRLGEIGDATIDTHDVAAHAFEPFGSEAPPVLSAMGGNSSNVTGVSGTNPLYQESLRRSVQGSDLVPREGQSINWEGIRGMFPSSEKGHGTNMGKLSRDLWLRYRAGKMTQREVLDAIYEASGGIKPPAWAK